MRIVMAEDALLEARAHTRVAALAEDCAPWEMVPSTWYANPSYTRCPIGAEPDEDPDSAESWVRQLASEPIDDTAANALLDQALAGIDAKGLSPHDEEAAEVARQVMEALTRCGYFWCASSSDDGRAVCSWGHRGQRTPHKTWLRETRLQDSDPQARRSSKSEVRIEVAPDGQSDFWATVVRYGRGYGWPSISIRVPPRWLAVKARGLEVVDGQLVLELVEDGPEPLVMAAPAETEQGYGSGKPALARVTHDGHLTWQEPVQQEQCLSAVGCPRCLAADASEQWNLPCLRRDGIRPGRNKPARCDGGRVGSLRDVESATDAVSSVMLKDGELKPSRRPDRC